MVGGRRFGWLWAAFAVSSFGTWLAFDAFGVIAILVLHAGPERVALLAAAGLAVGAVLAVPLGPWMEFRRKRPVMVTMDLVRCAALLSIPAAFALGWLRFAQLLVVAAAVAAADITFKASSGAHLKALVRPAELLGATARFEATTWLATSVGPPLGGAAIGLFGPVATVLANAVSFLLSAVGVRAIGGTEPPPARTGPAASRAGELLAGWRYVLRHRALRPLFVNTTLVNGLIMATAPPAAVLMLGSLGFAPWQYGLAFGTPCLGGLLGARLAGRFVARFGELAVLRRAGALRACWSLGLAFIPSGTAGLAAVVAIQFGLVATVGVFNPVFTAYRLAHTGTDRTARTLAAWSITGNAATAVLTVLGGLLAGAAGPRVAIAVAGVLLLATPFLLPSADH